MRIPALLAALLLALAAAPPANAEGGACEFTYDGECDESWGTGLCPEGTDTWDCRRVGTPPGPESCRYSRDGECDEPGGTGACILHTDTADCRAEGIDPYAFFFGADDRIWPSNADMPWSAIGRLTFDSGGHCSGAMVGPDIVLTAAHCLFGGDGPGGSDRPLEFIAGASGPDFIARARIVAHYLPPEFDMHLHETTSDIDGYDWAFLFLERPIGRRTGWLELAPLTLSEIESAIAGAWHPVMQGGYSADATAFLSANTACRVVRAWDDNTFFHECDTLQGDSGSPLFIEENGRYRVIGIESATYPNEDGPYDHNMAVDARAFWKGPLARDPLFSEDHPPAPSPVGGGFKNTR